MYNANIISLVASKRLAGLIVSLAMVVPGLAFADPWQTTAHVTMVEASHVGSGDIYFTLDQPGGNCAIGTYFKWNIEGDTEPQQIANAQAVFATLLTAKISKQKVRVVGDFSDCIAQLLYVEQ